MTRKSMLSLFAVMFVYALSAQENRAIVRRFEPALSDSKRAFECFYFRSRFVTLKGELVFRRNGFKHSLFKTTHILHGKAERDKLVTLQGEFRLRSDSLDLTYKTNEQGVDEFAKYKGLSYSIIGMELTTVRDSLKNIFHMVVFLIPREKIQMGEEIINDFTRKVLDQTNGKNDLSYIDVYMIASKLLREAEDRFYDLEIFVFDRAY